MQEVLGQVPGGSITEEVMVRGQITGSAVIERGAHLLLLGQVTENLFIEDGGSAEVLGMVCGDVVNRGKLELSGVVIGVLRDESGDSAIDEKARIGHEPSS